MDRLAKAHLTPRGRCSECGREQVRLGTDGMGQVIDIPDPCVHLRPPKPRGTPVQWPPTSNKPQTAAEEPDMGRPPKAPPETEREIFEHVRGRLTDEPGLTGNELRAEVKSLFGIEYADKTFSNKYATPARAELGISNPQNPRPHRAKASQTPSVDDEPSVKTEPMSAKEVRDAEKAIAPADAAFSKAVHENAPILEENRSLRATYEAGEYIRLEEQDGEWVLSARMAFADADAARRALSRLVA